MLRIIVLLSVLGGAAAAPAQERSDSLSLALHEIVVSANQPATRLEGSTLVTNVAGSNLQHLGSALDVLARLPMLEVDGEAVSVAGRGTPGVYIDGRPMRDSSELQRLQSANLRKVELLMAPGAMYGSDVRAVLKLTTRRNFADGLSVTARGSADMRRRLSANGLLDVNYRAGRFDFFATATAARSNKLIKGTTLNSALLPDGGQVTVGSSQRSTYPSANGAVKAGFNYARSDMSAGAYYRYHPEWADFMNRGSEWADGEAALSRDVSRTTRARSHMVSAYFDGTFAGKYHLHFDGDVSFSNSDQSVLTSYPGGEIPAVGASAGRHSRLLAGKLYTGFPLAGGSFDAGVQGHYTRTTLDSRMHNAGVEQYIPSVQTDARQTSAALFAAWKRTLGAVDLSAGVRYEYVDYLFNVNGKRDSDVSRREHLLTPDLQLGYSFGERAQVSVAYKTRTLRPPYSQLTGALNYVGRHEIEGGNAALRDERMHNVQLFGMWGDFILQADWTRSTDTYAYVKRLYPAPTLQLLMQPVNVDVSALSVYVVWSREVGPWRPDLTLGAYRQWLTVGGQSHDRPLLSYSFDNVVTLPLDFVLTLNVRGSSGGDMHTNRFCANWFVMDASVSKAFLGKSLTVKLSATDVCNTARNDWSMNTFGVSVDKRQSYDNRGIALTVTYSFRPRRPAYKGSSAAPAELQRL